MTVAAVKRAKPPQDWQERFLTALANTGVVRVASAFSGAGRSTAYRERDRNPSFAEAWDDAMDDACDLMELEARRRAMNGVERPVSIRVGTDDQGRPLYKLHSITEYSDTLLIFLLKGARPERYRNGYDIKAVLSALSMSEGRP